MIDENYVYLKIDGSRVYAYGDEESLKNAEDELKTGKLYDAVIPAEEWAKNGSFARMVNGKIVLGYPDDVVLERQAETIRWERYLRLRECDKLSPPRWEGMTEAQRQAWRDYRLALLDIPQQEGFPWGGDVEAVPWPVKPE